MLRASFPNLGAKVAALKATSWHKLNYFAKNAENLNIPRFESLSSRHDNGITWTRQDSLVVEQHEYHRAIRWQKVLMRPHF